MSRSKPKRSQPRVDLSRSAVLINSDTLESEIVILDVSAGGFRLGEAENLRVGELVKLRVEHEEEFRGEIRWVLGREAGGIFLTPMERN